MNITSKRRTPGIKKALDFLLSRSLHAQNEHFPSTISLAAHADVAPATMCKAIRQLRSDGIVIKQGKHFAFAKTPGSQSDEDTSPGSMMVAAVSKKYLHVKNLLLHEIATGRYDSVGTIPSCKEMAHHFRTSYRSVKKACSELVHDGVLLIDKRSYAVNAVRLAPESAAKIVLLWPMYENGEPCFGVFGTPVYQCLEREFAHAGVSYDFILYRQKGEQVLLADRRSGKPAQLQQDSSILGFILVRLLVTDRSGESIIKTLNEKKATLVVFDLGGHSLPASEGWARTNSRMNAVVTGSSAACGVGRFLYSLGHRSIAFLSPYHAEEWSQARFAVLANLYRSDHMGVTIQSFTSNKNATDYYEKVLGGRSEEQTILSISVSRRLGQLSLAPLENPTSVNDVLSGLETAEIYHEILFLCNRALADSAITAWICVNDSAAILALDFLTSKGIDVPGRISLIGFDDSPIARLRGLTTYRFDFDAMVATAVRMLVHPSRFVRQSQSLSKEVEGAIVNRFTTARV